MGGLPLFYSSSYVCRVGGWVGGLLGPASRLPLPAVCRRAACNLPSAVCHPSSTIYHHLPSAICHLPRFAGHGSPAHSRVWADCSLVTRKRLTACRPVLSGGVSFDHPPGGLSTACQRLPTCAHNACTCPAARGRRTAPRGRASASWCQTRCWCRTQCRPQPQCYALALQLPRPRPAALLASETGVGSPAPLIPWVL